MNVFNINEKRTIIAILIAIMEADEIIDTHEMNFLDDVIMSFEMTESEMDIIEDIDLNMAISVFKNFDTFKKETAIKCFLDMAKCDGYIDPRELDIINRLGS